MNNFSQIKIFFLSVILLISGSSDLWAESITSLKKSENYIPKFSEVKNYDNEDINKVTITPPDSVIYYTRGANGLIVMPPDDWDPFPYNVRFRDTVIYNPAYLPVVFDGKVLPSDLDFISGEKKSSDREFRLIPREETLAPLIDKVNNAQKLRRSFYMNMNNIQNVRYDVATLKTIPKLNEKDVTKRNFWNDLIATEDPIKVVPVELPKIDLEYIYWTRGGEHSLQASQNFISDNWRQGGTSNYILRSYQKFFLNYKKDKITFDNTLEWKLSFQKVFRAEKNGMNISEDLFRMENKFGLKAYNKWSYSALLETKTQLFKSKKLNSDAVQSAFLSPLNVNLGLGMSYLLEKKYKSDKARKLKFSQSISPLSLNYIYLNYIIVENKQGVEVGEGKRSKTEIGSLINTDLEFKFNRYMTWTSRLKYFTNYERAEFEFENRFVMELTRFLSTNINVYWKFDDGDGAIYDDKTFGYFQLNEMISFGLNYKW